MVRPQTYWLAGAAAFFLLLELLFRLLPVSTATNTGYYIDSLILTYPPNHSWTVSTGWDLRNAQALKANNFGFSASRDFRKDEKAVALIGDSFVESSMLPAIDRPEAQLARALVSRPVFAMGSPGTALLDYAERIRFARKEFGIRDFVVLMERGDIMQSLCGSGNINGVCMDPATHTSRTETLPPPSFLKKIFRHSSLAQYLFSQLKLNPNQLWRQISKQALPATSTSTNKWTSAPPHTDAAALSKRTLSTVDAVAAAFFAQANAENDGTLLLILDSDRSGSLQEQSGPDPVRDRFMQLAQAAGAIIIDTKPVFRRHMAQSRLHLNVGPYDDHMNALAISLIAHEVAAQLRPR